MKVKKHIEPLVSNFYMFEALKESTGSRKNESSTFIQFIANFVNQIKIL